MDRRALAVVGLGAVVVAALLWVMGQDTGPALAPVAPTAPVIAEPGHAPDVPPARMVPTLPVSDDHEVDDDPDALTADEKDQQRASAEAVLQGAIEICLGPWAADQGLAEEPVTIKVAALTTEEGLARLTVKPPPDAPETQDCLQQTIGALPWPALPRTGDLEQTWRFTGVPGSGETTLEAAAARVEAVSAPR